MDKGIVSSKSQGNTAKRYTFRTSSEAWYQLGQYLPNPDRVLTKRSQSIVLYREMLSDAHLLACLDSREAATLSHDWTIDRGDCPKRLYDVIFEWFFSILERKSSVEDLSRDELIANLMDVVYYGYQPAELSWELLRGFWVPSQIIPKPPEWFCFTVRLEDGIPELRFLSREEPFNGEPPPDQFTLVCPRIKPSFDNPYGRGVASRCFWPIVFKRAGTEFWLNFMERFGTPWVKGTLEDGDDAALTNFCADLRVLVQDAVIAVNGRKNVELMESKTASGDKNGFKELCDFFDSQMSKTILGHTLATDSNEKNSYAATRGALTVRQDLIKRDLLMIKSFFNDIINLTFLRNGYRNTPRPTARPYYAEAADTERATRDEALTRTGIRFTKSYYKRAYSLQDDDIKDIVYPEGKQVTGIPAIPNDDPASEQKMAQQKALKNDKSEQKSITG